MLIQVKVAKLNELVDFDVSEGKFPAASLEYSIRYGLTQAVNDAHAAIARKNFETDSAYFEAVREKVNKRIEQIRSGDVPGTRAPADPKLAVARKLAKDLSESEMEAALAYIAKQRAKAAKDAA